jgi:ABC-type transport system involved in multi-copper enzyme maturation permease subunit
MVGPVLNQEMLLGRRRSQLKYLRWVYVVWLLAQLLVLAGSHWAPGFGVPKIPVRPAKILADFGAFYFMIFVIQHFILLVLVTPALAAGAITDEKASGTLQYLLTTNLTPGEIIADKFLSRLAQALFLLLPGLPLVCFLAVFGGADFGLFVELVAASILVGAGTAAASLLASVWCRHTRDAVLSLYSIGAAVVVVWWLFPAAGVYLAGLNPLPALDLYDPHTRPAHLLKMCLIWTGLTAACLGIASWRLRPAYVRFLQGGRPKKERWWRLRRLAPGHDPIRWKERHVEGIAPLAILRRLPAWLGFLLVFVATTYSCGNILLSSLPVGTSPAMLWSMIRKQDTLGVLDVLLHLTPASGSFYWQGFTVMLLAMLVVGVRCSGAVTSEREKGTWEALLLTPLDTRQLIRAKLWGVIGACLPYLAVFGAIAVPLAMLNSRGALLATLLWLGVTVVAMAYAGAAGLWCSVRSRNSWRSLLSTLAFCYLGGFVFAIPTLIAALILSLLIIPFLAIIELLTGAALMGNVNVVVDGLAIGVCLALTGLFLILAERLIATAEYRVNTLERTRHWSFTPLHRRQHDELHSEHAGSVDDLVPGVGPL